MRAWKYKEFDRQTAIDALLLYDESTTQRREAVDWIKVLFKETGCFYGEFKPMVWGTQNTPD